VVKLIVSVLYVSVVVFIGIATALTGSVLAMLGGLVVGLGLIIIGVMVEERWK